MKRNSYIYSTILQLDSKGRRNVNLIYQTGKSSDFRGMRFVCLISLARDVTSFYYGTGKKKEDCCLCLILLSCTMYMCGVKKSSLNNFV